MRIQVAGRQMDVGEALRTRIEEELSARVAKYFSRPADAIVTVSKNAIGVEVDCAMHLDSGFSLQAHGHGADAHIAFSDSLDKIEKRLRRYKRRLKNHHAHNGRAQEAPEDAAAYVLAPLEEDQDDADPALQNGAETAPLVIAETKIQVKTMTVSMAVLQLELADAPAIMFRNAAHGQFNMVYRRPDGNIGWVDPAR